MLDQRGQIHPALAGVEDGARPGDRVGGDARDHAGDLLGLQQLRLVADTMFVGENRRDGIAAVVRVPGQAAVEAQPRRPGLAGEEGAVAVDAGHAQRMVGRRAHAGGVQPGQGPTRGAATDPPFGDQRHGHAAAQQVHGRGDAENAAADDGDM